MTDWPVLFIGFPLLIVGAPAGMIVGRILGRRIPTTPEED